MTVLLPSTFKMRVASRDKASILFNNGHFMSKFSPLNPTKIVGTHSVLLRIKTGEEQSQ